MTKTEMIQQELADMGVRVVSCPQLKRKAIATRDGFVGLGRTETSREERTVLEHEKQHFRLGAFYAPEDGAAGRRAEAQVQRALYHELCPPETLEQLLRAGRTIAEIAEMLETTEELVSEAFAYYHTRDPHFCRTAEP